MMVHQAGGMDQICPSKPMELQWLMIKEVEFSMLEGTLEATALWEAIPSKIATPRIFHSAFLVPDEVVDCQPI
jgi:hypothetical protein